ncbi:hypothetical protein K7J14_15145 [Treponema zuelzerae]|uniref:Uncharacterized protein n=1 Tax=Teretinema zuelzerae TaxID=156 RepID=A0AAE3EJT6_9SPIR|nr:hypothetical protein [Teretinema zuelzerae]MCD1656034.1 hypothetical protein [Teretinema zuelzerae]
MQSTSSIIAFAIVIVLFILFSRDAEKNNITLSKTTKVLFLLTFTMPFVVIWYFIKRRKKNKEKI